MAATYHATTTNTNYAAGKSMLSIFLDTGTTNIVKVYRVWILNNGTVAVTGVLTTFDLRLVSARGAAGTAISVVKHDSLNNDLPTTIYVETNASLTDGSLLRRILYSNDEPAVAGNTMDEWELVVPLMLVWDSGYGDANIQPLTLRAGSSTHNGFHVKHSGTTTVGSVDIDMEFTIE